MLHNLHPIAASLAHFIVACSQSHHVAW